MVLGVYPTQDGYKSVRIRPYIHDLGLTWAKGRIPTPFGAISVSWQKKADIFNIQVTMPENAPMDAVLEMPDGTQIIINEPKTEASCHI